MAFKFLESSYSVLFTFITIRSNPSLIETTHIVVWEHFDILQKKKNSLNTHYIQFWMTSFPIKLLYFIYWEIIIILFSSNTYYFGWYKYKKMTVFTFNELIILEEIMKLLTSVISDLDGSTLGSWPMITHHSIVSVLSWKLSTPFTSYLSCPPPTPTVIQGSNSICKY